MPVPVWDCTDMSVSVEPLDSVLSDDIWKKFDLDEPLDAQYIYGHQSAGVFTGLVGTSGLHGMTIDKAIGTTTSSTGSVYSVYSSSNVSACNNGNSSNAVGVSYEEYTSGQAVCLPEFYDKVSCRESREIRHHDCMWAGLCISKEHNRTLPAKKDALVNSKRVPAGRSLLISSRTTSQQQQQQQAVVSQQTSPQQQQQSQHQSLYQQRRNNRDGLESDGDSARPETPQSSESEIEDDENEDDDDNDNDEDEDEEDDYAKDETSPPMITSIKQEHRHTVKQEIEDGPLIFKHDQISINEKLSECMGDEFGNSVVKSAPVSEVTGQLVRKFHQHQYPHHHHQNRHHHRNHHSPPSPPPTAIPYRQHHNTNHHHNNNHHHNSNHNHHNHHHQNNARIKIEDEHESYHEYDDSNDEQQQRERIVKHEPDNWNTLNDHCYHQPSSKKLEHLGVQTPSDSEEEIDVVTFEKPCRPAALPTYPSIADQQHFQLTVKSALKEKPAAVAPRPRGRPPSSGTPRKRTATSSDAKPSKRPKHRTYLSRSKVTKNGPPTPLSSPLKTNASSIDDTSQQAGTSRSSSSDDEPDTEKRSLHNNMERQRRIELRNAFEDLRLLVPDIENKEKAPKVAILRQAAIYCDMLTEIDRVTAARVIEMKRRQERLRTRLSQLRRSLAMTR